MIHYGDLSFLHFQYWFFCRSTGRNHWQYVKITMNMTSNQNRLFQTECLFQYRNQLILGMDFKCFLLQMLRLILQSRFLILCCLRKNDCHKTISAIGVPCPAQSYPQPAPSSEFDFARWKVHYSSYGNCRLLQY